MSLAGLLFAGATVVNAIDQTREEIPLSQEAQASWWVPAMSLYLGMAMLIVLALPALYLLDAHRTGAGGLALLVVATLGVVAIFGMMWTMAFVPPSLATEAPAFLDAEDPPGVLGTAFMVTWISATVAFVSLGALVAWGGTLSRWAGGLFAAGAVAGFLPDPVWLIGDALMAVGLLWMGVALWRHAARSGVTALPGVEPAAVTAIVGSR